MRLQEKNVNESISDRRFLMLTPWEFTAMNQTQESIQLERMEQTDETRQAAIKLMQIGMPVPLALTGPDRQDTANRDVRFEWRSRTV